MSWLLGVSLVLTSLRVARPVVVLVHEHGELTSKLVTLEVALARCRECSRHWRVLPSDVLPHKRYGLAVISSLCSAHVLGNKSLREVAWQEHTGQTPAHSTLHAWTEGLGAFALGRLFGTLPGARSFSSILATTKARWSELTSTITPPPPIDPQRFRSEARGERLTATASVLTTARAVLCAAAIALAVNSTPLCAWRQLSITFGVPAPFAFRTGIVRTPSEHVGHRDREIAGLPQQIGDPACQPRTRSPPGDSNRSLPTSTPPSISSDAET